MKYEEVIDYLSENVKKRKKGKSIREQVNETKCEMNERGITFDETSLEIYRVIKEENSNSYTDIQNILNSVVSILAIFISAISIKDSFADTNHITYIAAGMLSNLFIIIIAGFSIKFLLLLDKVNKKRMNLRNKEIAALIQMQKNKKETGKDEKNS